MVIYEVRKPDIREKTEEEKVATSLIEAAKNSTEVVEKLGSILSESLDKEKFKKIIMEEALKDPELRNKLMLELLKKL